MYVSNMNAGPQIKHMRNMIEIGKGETTEGNL